MDIKVDIRYIKIAEQFQPCLDQIQKSKGLKRHGTDQEFKNQLTWILRELPFFLGQMIKKAYESIRLSPEKQIEEITGAINYGIMHRMNLLENINEKHKD